MLVYMIILYHGQTLRKWNVENICLSWQFNIKVLMSKKMYHLQLCINNLCTISTQFHTSLLKIFEFLKQWSIRTMEWYTTVLYII